MIVYQNLEDSLYNVIEGLFPDWRIIFAFGNGPEPATPYCVIDVHEIDMVGREYQSTLAHLNTEGNYASVTIQDNTATVAFKFLGKQDQNTTTSEMANKLQMMFRTPKGYELLAKNNLSLHTITKFPRTQQKRDTDVYMVYEIDAKFAYCNVITDEIDHMEVLGLHATYYDAGREPDHIISHEIDLTPPV